MESFKLPEARVDEGKCMADQAKLLPTLNGRIISTWCQCSTHEIHRFFFQVHGIMKICQFRQFSLMCPERNDWPSWHFFQKKRQISNSRSARLSHVRPLLRSLTPFIQRATLFTAKRAWAKTTIFYASIKNLNSVNENTLKKEQSSIHKSPNRRKKADFK